MRLPFYANRIQSKLCVPKCFISKCSFVRWALQVLLRADRTIAVQRWTRIKWPRWTRLRRLRVALFLNKLVQPWTRVETWIADFKHQALKFAFTKIFKMAVRAHNYKIFLEILRLTNTTSFGLTCYAKLLRNYIVMIRVVSTKSGY